MATQTEDLSSSPITRSDRGRIYDRPSDAAGGHKGMWTFLLLLAVIIAAVIVLAWAF